MKKSKRQRQIDLLERLLNRVNTSNQPKDIVRENTDWISKKMSEVAGGDVMLDSGGLTRDDMILANGMWNKHSQQVHRMFTGMDPANDDMPA